MSTMPRFTAPIVELARRNEYRVRRAQPMKVYEGRSEFPPKSVEVRDGGFHGS